MCRISFKFGALISVSFYLCVFLFLCRKRNMRGGCRTLRQSVQFTTASFCVTDIEGQFRVEFFTEEKNTKKPESCWSVGKNRQLNEAAAIVGCRASFLAAWPGWLVEWLGVCMCTDSHQVPVGAWNSGRPGWGWRCLPSQTPHQGCLLDQQIESPARQAKHW